MNQSPPNNAAPLTNVVQIPEPGYPMLTRAISNPLFPPEHPTKQAEPITWTVGSQHPLIPEMRVMRMFISDEGVDVYSVSADGHSGMRNMISLGTIRLVEEAMPLEVFIQELAAAEGPDDEEEEDDEEDEEEENEPTAAAAPTAPVPNSPPPNGQTNPS